ncbi:MAG: alanine racemase [Ruminococcus sp.]|nr:alanine racemase [Ruminococcus sp.]
MKFPKRCYAEIDLDSIEKNLDSFRKGLPSSVEVLCVVKACCYGHFDEAVVPFLENELGVRWFAVANLTEANRLRKMGIKGEILILGWTYPEYTDELIKLNVIQACTELAYARELSQRAARGKVRLHCAVDTGMTRIGLTGTAEENARDLLEMTQLSGVKLEGIFTHFAVADSLDEDKAAYTRAQRDKLLKTADKAEKLGVILSQVHFLNSAGGVYHADEKSTLARLGIILYGLYPDPDVPLPFELAPVMTLKAIISQVKEIEAGTSVSYGRTFTAEKRMKLATITAGYADGYPRLLSNKGYVLINGRRCPITGRVCMDQFMVDVTDAGEVKSGDEAVLIGCQGNERITADDIAKMIGTIGYEIVCGISARVPRAAYRHGELTGIYSLE